MLASAAMLGFGCGFVGSIPVAGPVAALVFSRGLEDRARSALYLASGAALVEGAYAYLAFWGFAELLARYAWLERASHVAAAAIPIGLGLHFALRRSAPAHLTAPAPRTGAAGSFALGVAITALNPALIAGWTAAVTALYGLGLVRFEPSAALPFSLGACAGIALWFATLLGLLSRFRARLSQPALERLRRGMGALLVALGIGFATRL